MKGINSSLNDIIKEISDAHDIVISGHIDPDADSIGSSLALAHLLSKIGKKPKVLMGDYKEKFHILPGFNYLYKGNVSDLKLDLFICVDCGDINRLGENLELFLKARSTIVIDHHISNNFFGKLNYIDANASSTCELIYILLDQMGEIDQNIASCLYAGILSDTGGFRYKSTSPYTLEIASKLLSCNIPFNKIYDEVMYMRSLNEFKSYISIVNKFEVVTDINVAYTSVTLDEMDSLNITFKDLEGIGEFLMRIRGVEISIFAYEKFKGITKISLRSRHEDVNKIAGYFNGGGHKYASGCIIEEEPLKAIANVINKIRNEHS